MATVNPFGSDNDFTFRHQARSKVDADTTRLYRVYAKTRSSGGAAYSWEATSSVGSGSVGVAGLTQSTATWNLASDLLAISCDSTDELTFEITSAEVGSFRVTGLSIVEEDD